MAVRDLAVGVLDYIVCERREPVFANNHSVGEPRVEELLLSRRSCNNDVQGCICGRVGRYVSDSPRIKKNTLPLTTVKKIGQIMQQYKSISDYFAVAVRHFVFGIQLKILIGNFTYSTFFMAVSVSMSPSVHIEMDTLLLFIASSC